MPAFRKPEPWFVLIVEIHAAILRRAHSFGYHLLELECCHAETACNTPAPAEAFMPQNATHA